MRAIQAIQPVHADLRANRRRAARRFARRLGEFPDPEDLRAAVGARALNRRATVLHGHLHRIHDLDLLLLLDAVALGHRATSWVGWTPIFTLRGTDSCRIVRIVSKSAHRADRAGVRVFDVHAVADGPAVPEVPALAGGRMRGIRR